VVRRRGLGGSDRPGLPTVVAAVSFEPELVVELAAVKLTAPTWTDQYTHNIIQQDK